MRVSRATATDVEIELPGSGHLSGAVSRPAGTSPRPGVVVIHEAFGGQFGVRAAAINYGDVPKDAARVRGSCPIVASYGARDLVMCSRASRLRSHLKQAGVEHDVKTYEHAGHSFMTDGNHPVGKLVFLPLRSATSRRPSPTRGSGCTPSSRTTSQRD